jgi:hypothetical protein
MQCKSQQSAEQRGNESTFKSNCTTATTRHFHTTDRNAILCICIPTQRATENNRKAYERAKTGKDKLDGVVEEAARLRLGGAPVCGGRK